MLSRSRVKGRAVIRDAVAWEKFERLGRFERLKRGRIQRAGKQRKVYQEKPAHDGNRSTKEGLPEHK